MDTFSGPNKSAYRALIYCYCTRWQINRMPRRPCPPYLQKFERTWERLCFLDTCARLSLIFVILKFVTSGWWKKRQRHVWGKFSTCVIMRSGLCWWQMWGTQRLYILCHKSVNDWSPFLSADSVCGPEAGVQQASVQDWPPLPLPLHLPVLHRQLQLRYAYAK